MRGNVVERRSANETLDTINAAASAIASSENRLPQATVQKRRWGSCCSLYWCFGTQKQHKKRIGHAGLVPEAAAMGTEGPAAAEITTQAPSSVVLPFAAPPSSPASFLPSEPPSATQSPVVQLCLPLISASIYSPGGPAASIFAIGPYAYETQLVSPPVFSPFTSEPSTAPFTPPESIHLTTPSSPEVPYARLLEPSNHIAVPGQRFHVAHSEFQSYQLHPGSPVGHSISPSSGVSGSGTSSPFPDCDFVPVFPHFLEFQKGDPPKLWNLDKLYGYGSCFLVDHPPAGSLTTDSSRPRSHGEFVLNRQSSDIAPLANSFNRHGNDKIVADHTVSFEIFSENTVRCVEKKPAALLKAASLSLEYAEYQDGKNENYSHTASCQDCLAAETSNCTSDKASVNGETGQRHQKHRSITLGSLKEFNFNNSDRGNDDKHGSRSDWWINENVVGKESGACKTWSFFPLLQPGFS